MSDNVDSDFYKGWGPDLDAGVDENGNPLKSEEGENGRHAPPKEAGDEESGIEYPSPKPSKPIDESDIPKNLYGEKSPELFKEKEEKPQDPEDKEIAEKIYPNSPQLAGEPEVLRNFITVPHKISGEAVLAQQGYRSLKETVQKCQPCRQLDYGEIRDEDLSRIVIDGIQLKNALIENTSFQDTRARNADFSGCEFNGQVNFDDADLRNSSFRNCDLSSCSFRNADLTNCNLIGATLPEADMFAGAQMAGVKTEEEKPSPQREIFPG